MKNQEEDRIQTQVQIQLLHNRNGIITTIIHCGNLIAGDVKL